MQIRTFLLLLVAAGLLFQPQLAAEPNRSATSSTGQLNTDNLNLPRRQDEDQLVSVQFGFYNQDDGSGDRGGNANIDEDEMVYEAIILVDQPLSEKDRLSVRFLGDVVSSASQTRLHNPSFRALQSNPSGNLHGELGLGWQRQYKRFTASHNVSFGGETSNYWSIGYGSSVTTTFNDENTTLGGSFQGYTDHFQVKLFNGVEPGFDTRQTLTGEISLTQVLTPLTIGNLTFNHTHQFGFLSTTFNSVFVNGLETSEEAPSTRRRNSITGRVKQSLSKRSAAELGYRFYNDEWEINSHTVETRYFQYVADRRFLLEPNYRFYTQTAAFFYQESFTTIPEFRTSDPDIGDFTGHIFGIKVTWNRPQFLPKWSRGIYLGYNYYYRTDDLKIFWITTGYTATF